jgi:acetyltransferase-like isoleucine patch superfamily enzyme
MKKGTRKRRTPLVGGWPNGKSRSSVPDPALREQGLPGPAAPVHIEDNVWLELNVVVLKGLTIGRDSVIGAGSIVTRSIPAGVLAAGQPARVIRDLASPQA